MIPYIKVVRQYERMALFTLGRYAGMKQPGLNLFFWPFHATQSVDLREEVLDIPRQTNITLDNAPIDIDFLVYMRIMEDQAEKSVLEVVDYYGAVVGIATTTLRAVIGEMNVDDVLSQRERINEELRSKLDDITERWGIKVTQVEIREIEPARDIQEAMNRQMSAERLRRAAVTEAEGHAPSRRHRRRRRKAGGNTPRRRASPIRNPHRRRRPPSLRPPRRRLQHRARQHQQSGAEHRPQHAQPPILRHPQRAAGGSPKLQIHLPDGVHQTARPVHRRLPRQRR